MNNETIFAYNGHHDSINFTKILCFILSNHKDSIDFTMNNTIYRGMVDYSKTDFMFLENSHRLSLPSVVTVWFYETIIFGFSYEMRFCMK